MRHERHPKYNTLIVAKSYTETYPSTAETYARTATGFLQDQD